MKRLSALPYYGGKSVLSPTGKGRWIASLLPARTDVLYCEPFAGMLGVLLHRQPSKTEIVNDASERVVNWWRVVRDRPAEFEWMIQHTPHSRKEFEWAKANLDCADELRRALAFHCIVTQSALSTDIQVRWKMRRQPNVGSTNSPWKPGRIGALAERLRRVQLECCDAVDLLRKTAGVERAVIYCDPPYASADTSPYAHDVDSDKLAAVLLAQQGQVAISVYGGEWDCLGWHRQELETFTSQIGRSTRKDGIRTEVLWTNYEPQMRAVLPAKAGAKSTESMSPRLLPG